MGFTQVHGVDYDDTHMPTMALASFFATEAIGVNSAEELVDEVWDISGAYYLSDAEYISYMLPPDGYGAEGEVWLLLKGMPGTKDAGHNFSRQFTKFLVEKVGLTPNPADGATFHLAVGKTCFFANFHVDDGAVRSNSQQLLDKIFDLINNRFPMKRQKPINLMTGIYVIREKRQSGVKIAKFHQQPLIEEIAELAGVKDRKKVTAPTPTSWKMFSKEDTVTDPEQRKELDKYPFRSLLGKTAYVVRCTRRDCLFLVAILQRFQTNYGWKVINTLLWLITYLYNTRERCLVFRGGYDGSYQLFAMADASYANCPITRTSHGGYVIYLLGCPILATSKKQPIVALSSCEAEFMTAFEAAKRIMWVLRLLSGLQIEVKVPVPILEDNNAAIQLSRRPSLNSGHSRHMEVRWHWLQAQVEARQVRLTYLTTAWQVADLFTKAVNGSLFNRLSPLLMGEEEINQGAIRASLENLEFESSNRIPQEGEATSLMRETTVKRHERMNMMRHDAPEGTFNEVMRHLEAGLFPTIALTKSAQETREEVARIFPRMTPTFFSCAVTELTEINVSTMDLTQQCARLRTSRMDILRALRASPMSRGPIDFSQPLPRAGAQSSDDDEELAEQFAELLHGPPPPYVTPPLHAVAAPEELSPEALRLSPGLESPLVPSFSFPPSVFEEKKEEGDPPAPGPAGLGFSLLRPHQRAWSPRSTRDAVKRARQGARYPAAESLVAISGPVQKGKKYHHLRCSTLFCKFGDLRNIGYHAGVRICTLREVRRRGYSQCLHCHNQLREHYE